MNNFTKQELETIRCALNFVADHLSTGCDDQLEVEQLSLKVRLLLEDRLMPSPATAFRNQKQQQQQPH